MVGVYERESITNLPAAATTDTHVHTTCRTVTVVL